MTGSVLNGWGFTTTFEMLHCSVQPASNIASDIAKGAFRRTPRFGTKPASYCSRALPKIRALNQMQAAGGIARAAPGPKIWEKESPEKLRARTDAHMNGT